MPLMQEVASGRAQLKRRDAALVVFVVAALFAISTIAGSTFARKLLFVMDSDSNGKISKQEFMKFMEAEFKRLDRDNSGELDVTELRHAKLRVSRFGHLAK